MITKTVLVPKCPHSMIWQIRRVQCMHIASVRVAIGVALVENLEAGFWILDFLLSFFS